MTATEIRQIQGKASMVREELSDIRVPGVVVYAHLSRARRLLLLVEECLAEAALAAPLFPTSGGAP